MTISTSLHRNACNSFLHVYLHIGLLSLNEVKIAYAIRCIPFGLSAHEEFDKNSTGQRSATSRSRPPF